MSEELIFYTNPMSRGRIVRWMLEEVGAPYRTEVLERGSSRDAIDLLRAFLGREPNAEAFLAKLDVDLVVCGHSERRDLFGETDEMVNRKVAAIQHHGMTPIMCCGETLEEREAGNTEAKVLGQIEAGLAGRTNEQIASLVIAYEPIWAIGTGRTASDDDAGAMATFVRATIADIAGDAAESTRILYGGSMNPGNVAGLMAKKDIDGGLVGGASLDPEQFAQILQFGR